MVWVQAVSLAPWVRAVVNGEPVGSPIRFQTESVFGGKLSTTGVAYWEGLSTHDIVLAWRRHESPDDKAEILRATEVAQRLAGKNDNYLFFMIASAFSMNPKVMKPVIEKKMARFKRRLKEVGETAFVNENTPVVDTYCPDYVDEERGLVFSVEQYCDHGVITQAVKGKSVSKYASDFPIARRIYSSPQEAALALIAVAKNRNWRAIV